jgi:hypothetical protein
LYTPVIILKDKFTFLGHNKFKAAIAAMSLSVLLLLPANLGLGGTIIQEAFGQFNLPLLEDEDTTTTPTTPAAPTTPPSATTTTNFTNTVQDPSIFLLYGFIGTTLSAQNASGGNALTAANDSGGYVVTGRFRVFANESLVRRFVAEMNLAAIDGSSFHNVTIREGAPHRFEVTEGGAAATAAVPVVSSSIVGSIYLDGGTTPVIDNVPMTLTVRGQSLAIQGIVIDQTRITDTGQRDTLSVIDRQSIYGTIPR